MPSTLTVQIDLGGKSRTLRLDMNALCGLHEQGQDIDALKTLLAAGKLNIVTIRILLWAFLISDSDDKGEVNFTPKTVGGWISTANMEYSAKTLGKFLTSQPKADAENPTEPAAPAPQVN